MWLRWPDGNIGQANKKRTFGSSFFAWKVVSLSRQERLTIPK
jgi:hypothetical protein